MPRQIPVDVAEPLIFAVQKHEVIYNTRHENYRNRELTELAWRKVADELQRDVASCKATWATLRGSFNRILAGMKPLPSGSATHNKPKWYLYEQMLFLQHHVSHGQQIGNLDFSGSMPSRSQDVDQDEFQLGSEETSCQSVWSEISLQLDETQQDSAETQQDSDETQQGSAETHTSTATQQEAETSAAGSKEPRSRKRKGDKADTDPVQTALVEYINKCELGLQQGNNQVSIETNPDLHYFRGLLPFMNKLNEINKLMFMTKTTGLLMDLIQSQESQ